MTIGLLLTLIGTTPIDWVLDHLASRHRWRNLRRQNPNWKEPGYLRTAVRGARSALLGKVRTSLALLLILEVFSFTLFLLTGLVSEGWSSWFEVFGFAVVGCCLLAAGWVFLIDGPSLWRGAQTLRDAPFNHLRCAQLVNDRAKFMLYLHDFSSGVEEVSFPIDRQSSPLGSRPPPRRGNRRRSIVTEQLEGALPVVFLHNPHDEAQDYAGIPLLVDDENWFALFVSLCESAAYVVLDYGCSLSSPGVKAELAHLSEHVSAKLIWIGTDEQLERTTDRFPGLGKNKIWRRFQLHDVNALKHGRLYPVLSERDPLFAELRKQKKRS